MLDFSHPLGCTLNLAPMEDQKLLIIYCPSHRIIRMQQGSWVKHLFLLTLVSLHIINLNMCHLPCTPNPYWAWKPRSIYLHSLLHMIQATTSNKALKIIATLYMLGWTIGSNKTGGIRFKNQKTWPRTNPWLIVYPYLAIRAPAALKEENKLFNRYSHFCCVRKSCFMAVLNSSTESPCLTQMRGDEKMNRMIFTFYGTFTCKIPSLWCDSTMERSLL